LSEEVKSDEWTDKVYKPDIREKWDNLYKKPEYNPLDWHLSRIGATQCKNGNLEKAVSRSQPSDSAAWV